VRGPVVRGPVVRGPGSWKAAGFPGLAAASSRRTISVSIGLGQTA
jgi:hypothetical protein